MAVDINQVVTAVGASSLMLDAALNNARGFITEGYKRQLSTDNAYALNMVNPNASSCVRMLHMEKLVLGQGDIHSRLMSLFQTVHDVADSCFLIIRGNEQQKTEIYLGVGAGNFTNAAMAFEALRDNFMGNFPGTAANECSDSAIRGMMQDICRTAQPMPSVSMVSIAPARRSMVDSSQDSLEVQGLDTLIDTMRGKNYTAVILATPLDHDAVLKRRHALESLASAISPLETINYQYGRNMTVSRQHSINMSIAEGINQSVSDAYSSSSTASSGYNRSSSSNSNSHFNSTGFGFGSQHGTFSSTAVTNGRTTTVGAGTSINASIAAGMSEGLNLGMSESWSTGYANHAISSILKDIDRQILRIEQCDAYGAWDTCSYFVSQTPSTVRIAAANFQALVCGENSTGNTNIWLHDHKHLRGILQHIAHLQIPTFTNGNLPCQAGTMVSGSELPILMNLPRKSVRGLPVTNMAAFGREAFSLRADDPAVNAATGGQVEIGSVYHMGEEEPDNRVSLDCNMFASHVLFAGTTGVGKSTLVAMMLNALVRCGIHFTLIEPVKGEYKHLLGRLPGLQVFTSDPHVCRLLRINPFEFRDSIQVLAHIDRLIDIFSVCWPLYAAQPAVLRECIEEAYINCGWDLSNSEYVRPGFKQYPTFSMLLEVLPEVIARSRFVGESKGTYEGALMARLGMLTRGIYGQILNGVGGVSDEELFCGNVIIDLSSAGSQETISLIMGLLIIRLREYRTASGQANNAHLKHVMVLEEAHNIFPREQERGAEGGENVAGKSVKMLVQCIAEMRSYGQGFFIADQSPSAIDIAGIRNTATKIVMQLPEEEDQQTIARSLSLTEEQTRELSRLPRRVAVVYQNSWLEPVLLKIRDVKGSSLKSMYLPSVDMAGQEDLKRARGQLVRIILPMAQRGVLDSTRLLDRSGRLAVSVQLNESKKRDLAAVCAYYAKWYAQEGPFSEEEDDETRVKFFCALLTNLLSCDLYLRFAPVPAKAMAGATVNSDNVYRVKCIKWRKTARNLVDSYALGLTENEKDVLIKLFLENSSDANCVALLGKLYPDG